MIFFSPCAIRVPIVYRALLCSAALAINHGRGADNARPDPLLQAVATGNATAWQARLKSKADVNVRDGAGNTALHLAALNHDLAAVDALLAAGDSSSPRIA